MTDLKSKAAGFWLIAAATVIAVVAAVVYAVFGVRSNTFNITILLGVLCAVAIGISLFFTKGLLNRLLPIGMSVFLALSFTYLLGNSIDDIFIFPRHNITH